MYKRQIMAFDECTPWPCEAVYAEKSMHMTHRWLDRCIARFQATEPRYGHEQAPVSYTHLRAHETVLDIVCRLLLEKKKIENK